MGIPGDRWNPNERREVYRNGYQPRLRQIAFEKLLDLRRTNLRKGRFPRRFRPNVLPTSKALPCYTVPVA